jgi:DNA repair photolyase
VPVRPISNPPNPWASAEVEYLEGAPPARLEVYEDHTKEILATNDSPDVGFRWSVNPYRGCYHACSYCLSGDTQILMADGRTKRLATLRAGDEIYGTVRRGDYRRYTRTRVLDHWRTIKPAYRVRLGDGTELIASGDHRFLTRRGWKHVTGKQHGAERRPHLTIGAHMLGTGAFASAPDETVSYRRGYLCGMIRGDGLIGHYVYDGRRRGRDEHHQFRLALIDLEGLQRTQRYLASFEIATHDFVFAQARANRTAMYGIRTHARAGVDYVRELIAWPIAPDLDWCKGFLSGLFDAEGCFSNGVLRISNKDAELVAVTVRCLERLGFDAVVEDARPVKDVRLRGPLREKLRFFHTVDPAITRKRELQDYGIKFAGDLRVVEIESLGLDLELFDITTGTGDFIANGVISHNCYARPSHEYLSFGAGTDFDRKIVVKPDAPALLRAAFDRPKWRGERVVFSGVTDCYQPLEASYRLTRGCLEVCAEYRNPVGIITKAPLIERDVDVLERLAKEADLWVTISIPMWDRDNARAIEPYVATPERRVKIIATLASRGINVGVNIAPMIPGISDRDLPRVLEEAKNAGASWAAYVFLRLPGSVASVFEERLRESMPLRADRIISLVRQSRGGALYDSRFGDRQLGHGGYADSARALFLATARRLGLDTGEDEDTPGDTTCEKRDEETTFRRPPKPGDQLDLFGKR